MGFKLFDKTSKEDKLQNGQIAIGQISQIPLQNQDIFVSVQKTTNLLAKIAQEENKFKAVEIIIDETPDGKQAYNTYLRLANQGINIELYNKNTKRRIKRYDTEVRDFCARMGVNNSEGLDGMINQLHGSAISRGGMACEVLVNENATDVEDVMLVDPATFAEYKWIPNEHRYAIYQNRTDGRKIDLYDGNFFYIPHQPKAGRPDGTLQFLPAVVTLTQFYQLLADGMRILNRIGYPRYDVAINKEALLNTLPASEKQSAEKQQKAYQKAFNDVRDNLRIIGKDSDILHFDDTTINVIGGGVNGSGIDIRAWFEVLEPLIVNSFTMTPVLMGRLTGGSYSLGTVEFKIVTDTVDSMRRGSKRILENIINLWARVKGYPIYAVVTHNPINWEVEKEKLETELLKTQQIRKHEEYGWISHDSAAMQGANVEKADNKNSVGMFEYISKNFREQAQNQTNEEETIEKGVNENAEKDNLSK